MVRPTIFYYFTISFVKNRERSYTYRNREIKSTMPLFKKPLFVVSVVVVVGIIGGIVFLNRPSKPTYDFIVAKRGNLVQEVSVTGRVKPAKSVDLAFEVGGRVSRVRVSVGDKVRTNQILVQLNNSELAARLAGAEADIKAEQAKLDELRRGARQEDIQVKEAELKKTEQDLVNEYDSVLTDLNNAYTKADDAVRTKTAAIFSGSKTNSYSLTFTSCNAEADSDSTFLRLTSDSELDAWLIELNKLNAISSRGELDQALINAQDSLTLFKRFLERTNATLTTGCALGDSALDTYRTSVSTGRTNIAAAFSDIKNLEQSIASEKLNVDKVQSELDLKLAGTAPEQISAQEAKVEQAEANLQNIQAQIAKTILRSPIDGIVTTQDAKIGEIASANIVIISLISEAEFQIEADIPEADIAKITTENTARLTLDAYGDDVVFEAQVITIEPAETIIEGVATYKTTFQFVGEDKRIKSGMTANIDILTGERKNVISVPQRALITKNGNKIVRILDDNGIVQEVNVKTGLLGSDGKIEIIEGVSEGDKVITFIEE